MLISSNTLGLSIRRQCDLLGISRSSYYGQAPRSQEKTDANSAYMWLIDEQYLRMDGLGRALDNVFIERRGAPHWLCVASP